MRGLRLGSAIAVAAFATACADQTITAPEQTSSYRGPSLSEVQGPVCPAGVSFPLRWRSPQGLVESGKVTVSNDETRLYLKFESTGSWDLEYLHYNISKTPDGIPQKKNGDVKLTAFQWSKNVNNAKSFTASRSLGSDKPGDALVVVVPTDVEGPWTNARGKTNSVYKTAYAGDREIDQTSANGKDKDEKDGYAAYFIYTVKACEVVPPPPPPPPPIPTTGVITITFDDGFRDAYTAGFAEMKKYGLPGNIAINPGPIESLWDGYLTMDMLNEMHSAGWSVVSHSWWHPDLKALSDAELDKELKDTQDWIRAKGYRGANIFVVPFHSWGPREEAAVKKYYTVARGNSVFQYWPDSLAAYPPVGNPYGLTGFEPEYAPYTTPEGRAMTRAVMQKAVDDRKFVDIFFHQVPQENYAAFAEMVKILAEFKPYIKSYATLFPGT